MRYYKVDPESVEDLSFKNAHSTMFELKSLIKPGVDVKALNPHQKEMSLPVRERNGEYYVAVQPQFRVIVPTGIAFSIPVKFQLRLTPNRDLSVKTGVTILGGTEVYDNDYTDEIKITLINNSDTPVYIFSNEVIAYGVLAKVLEYSLEKTDRKVAFKTIKGSRETEKDDEE